MLKTHVKKKPVPRLPPARFEISGGGEFWYVHDNEAKRGGETYEFVSYEAAFDALKALNPGSVIDLQAYRERKKND